VRKWIAPVAVIAALVVGGAFFRDDILEYSGIACATTIKRAVPSPDATRTAVIFERECGATTPFNTQVSLVPKGQSFSPRRYPSFLSIGGQHALAIRWVGERALEVDLPKTDRVFRNETTVDDVSVAYLSAGRGPN
jgi:hypothetical protein